MAGTIRERSGKAQSANAGVKVSIDFGGGDVAAVVVDTAMFTFREMHEVALALAQFAGPGLDPGPSLNVLVYAFVALRRTRADLVLDTMLDLPTSALSVDVDWEDDNSPEG